MAEINLSIQIKGLDELKNKLDAANLLGAPLRNFLNKSMLTIQGEAAKAAPVDLGNLRASLVQPSAVTIDSSPVPLYATFSDTTSYGVFVEFGTKPHWPPIKAIAPWAERHGIEPFLVARGISIHGTKAQPFMSTALAISEGKIGDYLNEAANEIAENFNG